MVIFSVLICLQRPSSRLKWIRFYPGRTFYPTCKDHEVDWTGFWVWGSALVLSCDGDHNQNFLINSHSVRLTKLIFEQYFFGLFSFRLFLVPMILSCSYFDGVTAQLNSTFAEKSFVRQISLQEEKKNSSDIKAFKKFPVKKLISAVLPRVRRVHHARIKKMT